MGRPRAGTPVSDRCRLARLHVAPPLPARHETDLDPEEGGYGTVATESATTGASFERLGALGKRTVARAPAPECTRGVTCGQPSGERKET